MKSLSVKKTEAHRHREMGPILLTGATGFLGIHLLHELTHRHNISVTCLVRASSGERAHQRLWALLKWYFPAIDPKLLERRVRVVAADIGEPRLGLEEAAYVDLSENHEIVVNAAAVLGEAATKSSIRRINVDGVTSLIEFARSGFKKELHHISTVDVAGGFHGTQLLAAFSERHLDEGQVHEGAYAETKFRAELLMRNAFGEGLTGAVYRVGYVAPHSVSGRFQKNVHQSYLARYIRSCTRLGAAAYSTNGGVHPTPVDVAASAIATLIGAASAKSQTYYVEAPQRLSQYAMIQALHAAGYPIRLLEANEFVERVSYFCNDQETLNAVFPDRGRNKLQRIPVDGRWSEGELNRLGFHYSGVSSGWFGQFLKHCVDVGYLEAPRFWGSGSVVDGLWS